MKIGSVVVLSLLFLAACSGDQRAYDLVVANGRVIDPETGFSGVANVGIRRGVIESISSDPIEGSRVIDASGLVVAPGFIDLHEHGQAEEAYSWMVRDGVTTALELEVGTGDVDVWYSERAGGQLVNYGVSVGHIRARMAVMDDPGTGLVPTGPANSDPTTEAQQEEMDGLIRLGLEQGALAVGFGSAYTPGAEMAEIQRYFEIAAEYGAPAHIHMRGGVPGLDSTLEAAREAAAPLHIVHVNSSASADIDEFLRIIQAAIDEGQDVTTETYPYGAGMTEITSALFDDWESWPEERYGIHQLVSTGERLDRESFASAREAGGTVIIHDRTEEMTRTAVASPLTMIASDGFLVDGRGHPRTSGSFAKVLGQYVRDEAILSLEAAIEKMTIRPARRLESRAPEFAKKGRLQVGMDADITVFDPATIIDQATYMDATQPSVGIPWVIVSGEVVVDGGEVTAARPGRPMRAPIG